MAIKQIICLALVGIVLFIQQSCATIMMQGCTEAFIRLTCPDDDIIHVADIRYSEVDSSDVCKQQLPPSQINVPHELLEFCQPDNATADGHMCMYVEDICEGKSDCVFYVSPHMIHDKEEPTINSEVIIKYNCKPGKKRKGEIAVTALVASVGILSLLIIGGLLIWRLLTQDQSTYADFTNDRSTASTSSGAGYGSGAISTGGEAATVSRQEDISVELRAPSAGGSNPLA